MGAAIRVGQGTPLLEGGPVARGSVFFFRMLGSAGIDRSSKMSVDLRGISVGWFILNSGASRRKGPREPRIVWP
eukprot:8101388-Pyramimonas_sp.AAC.1